MSKQREHIDPELAAWLSEQRVFFVATAPLSRESHINLSPKGGDSFRILEPLKVAYQDYTGSGAETAAHLRENGRIVLLFCAFEGPPRITRLHGSGRVLVPGCDEFQALAARFPDPPGTRAIVHVDVTRVSTSCGFGVPLLEFREQRDLLQKWAAQKGEAGLEEYRKLKNARSIDGLPAFEKEG